MPTSIPQEADHVLTADEAKAVGKQFALAIEGVAAVAEALKLTEAQLAEEAKFSPNLAPIARGKLVRTRDELRAVLKKAQEVARAVGAEQELLRAVAPGLSGDVSGDDEPDIGAVLKDSPMGRVAADVQFGGVTPAASFITIGEEVAAKAVSKLGARRAIGAVAAFGRFARGKVGGMVARLRTATALAAADGPFARAVAKAGLFFAVVATVRWGAPGLAAVADSPWAILLLGGFALYVLARR